MVFTDEASWQALMSRVQPGDTVVVAAFLDRFSRNFKEGVAIREQSNRAGA